RDLRQGPGEQCDLAADLGRELSVLRLELAAELERTADDDAGLHEDREVLGELHGLHTTVGGCLQRALVSPRRFDAALFRTGKLLLALVGSLDVRARRRFHHAVLGARKPFERTRDLLVLL